MVYSTSYVKCLYLTINILEDEKILSFEFKQSYIYFHTNTTHLT